MIKSCCLLLVSSFSICASAQENKLEFGEGMCEYTGYFDASIYTKEQLQNTFDMLLFGTYISTSATVSTFSEIENLSVDELNTECQGQLQLLNESNFVTTEFWEQIRVIRIKEIEESCELIKLTMLAYDNPEILLSYTKSDSLNAFYRDALIAGGEKLIDAWLALNEYQKSINGNPARLQRIFDEQFNSPEKMNFARIEVMRYGWWNTSNRLSFHDSDTDYFSEFKQLFTRVDTKCEEH